MKQLQSLLERKSKLTALKQMLDSEAPMDCEEGFMYADTLLKLVVTELQIEEIEKEKAAQ